MMDTNKVIVRPILTEKMTNLKETENKYAFEVHRKANKIDIKNAIEERFNVSVLHVSTMNIRGKKKRMGRFEGRRSHRKKAIVTLHPDDVIEFVPGAA